MQLLKEKEEGIVKVIEQLARHLGESFDVVDHWEADQCAIGIAKPDDHRVLVYISTWQQPECTYYVELEDPPTSEEEGLFKNTFTLESASFEELLAVTRKHLGK